MISGWPTYPAPTPSRDLWRAYLEATREVIILMDDLDDDAEVMLQWRVVSQ